MKNLERVVQDLVTENAVLQSRVQGVTELQQQLTRAEEAVRIEQQQRQQVSLVYMCVCVWIYRYCVLLTNFLIAERRGSIGQGQGTSSGSAATDGTGE